MKYKMKYVGLGGIIDFSKPPFLYDEHDLFNYELKFDTTDLIGRTRVNNIYSNSVTKRLKIQIMGNRKKELLDELEYKLNRDVMALSPGKLYINNEYLECYLSSSFKVDFDRFSNMECIEFTVFAENAKWITEEVHNFSIHEEQEVNGAFKFPFSFPFSWKSNKSIKYLLNTHYDESRAKLIFYGPVENPKVTIGGNVYQIHGELLESERYEINQILKTVEKITTTGDVINCFNLRDREHSVFKVIPRGENKVIYSEEFSLSVILYIERNEPKWN